MLGVGLFNDETIGGGHPQPTNKPNEVLWVAELDSWGTISFVFGWYPI